MGQTNRIMKLLNLGCGGERWSDPEWTHVDDLHEQFAIGTPERAQIDASANYCNFSVGSGKLPFDDNSFSGILASHFFEHFNAQDAANIMEECLRILEPGGVLLVSVPDASYFRRVYPQDRNENWPELFDVSDPPNPIPTWHQAALWFSQHAQIFTEDALWSHFIRAGFPDNGICRLGAWNIIPSLEVMKPKLNRRKFSLEMWAIKP
jgi:SAM-dependent methyltransferase